MEVTWDPVTISNHIQHYVTKEKIDTVSVYIGLNNKKKLIHKLDYHI